MQPSKSANNFFQIDLISSSGQCIMLKKANLTDVLLQQLRVLFHRIVEGRTHLQIQAAIMLESRGLYVSQCLICAEVAVKKKDETQRKFFATGPYSVRIIIKVFINQKK